MRVCSIEGCDSPHTARGWCVKHYKRWEVNGDPHITRRKTSKRGEPLFDRLSRYTAVSDGCWEWIGSLNATGYGQVNFANGTHLAHRRWYEVMRGPIPEGLVLDHLCRVRHCVNPWHLEPVTPGENNRRSQSHCPTCACWQDGLLYSR